MKKLAVCLLFIHFSVFAQEDKNDVELLKAPSSPAFNLMGISPSSIDKPTDLTSFAASVQNATNNFSALPSEYALEFLPYTLFSKQSMTTGELNVTNFKTVFKQTFTISLGIANELNKNETATPDLTKFGAGIKFSIKRAAYSKATNDKLDTVYNAQDALNKLSRNDNYNDPELKSYRDMKITISNNDKLSDVEKTLQFKKVDTLINMRKGELYENRKGDLTKEIKDKLNDLKLQRDGLTIDFASGVAMDFIEQTFNRSRVSRAGAWLTGDYNIGKQFDLLLIARYLYQPDKILADDTALLDSKNISTLDGGIRVIYKEPKKEKLSLSTEALYRSVLNEGVIDPSWRIVFNASYDTGQNQMITFSIGKDFDNSLIKENNLIAALNYIIGFGTGKAKK